MKSKNVLIQNLKTIFSFVIDHDFMIIQLTLTSILQVVKIKVRQ